MSDLAVLSLSGEFQLPEELRRHCVIVVSDGVCIEHITALFKADAANRYVSVRRALIVKYGAIRRITSDERSIKQIYERSGTESPKQKAESLEMSKMPIEQSKREFLAVIKLAIEESAVDVHWIVRKKSTKILFRIHGQIEAIDEFNFSTEVATGLLGAIYGEAKDGTDPSYSPRNQSACSLQFHEPPVAIRWQTVPTGDSQGVEHDVVLRITKQDLSSIESVQTLLELGYLPDQNDLLEAACNSPGGVILSGVTGSGKTTALRSLMQMARGDGEKKIYTVEDPIELRIFGATQRNARGGNMGQILKAFLRADPDIIMVGEVRDREVANVMQDILRSGHKMMTTTHAPSALGIISRLTSDEIGVHRETIVEPGFIALLAYQFLMPTLCECKLPLLDNMERIEKFERYLLGEHGYALDPSKMSVRNHNGCPKCRKGINGMTICAETIRLNYEMIKLIRDRKDAEALQAYRQLRHSAFDQPSTIGKTAYEVAIYKASQGIIDPCDVNNLCGAMSLQEIVRGQYEI